MKKRLPFSFTLLLIALFWSACAYSCFDQLAEADFLWGEKYEAQDIAEVYAEKQGGPDWAILTSSYFAPLIRWGWPLFHSSTSLISPPLQKAFSILRC